MVLDTYYILLCSEWLIDWLSEWVCFNTALNSISFTAWNVKFTWEWVSGFNISHFKQCSSNITTGDTTTIGFIHWTRLGNRTQKFSFSTVKTSIFKNIPNRFCLTNDNSLKSYSFEVQNINQTFLHRIWHVTLLSSEQTIPLKQIRISPQDTYMNPKYNGKSSNLMNYGDTR